ncbi:phosphatase PAP2 family protein [Alteribacillus sp. JSM 102045]|uniref:phosphatase PAP2 family protein n=1 Tax=Alteribacillus sp. JSM 102045 TaxID=1562101 RepID=UPI0035C1C441
MGIFLMFIKKRTEGVILLLSVGGGGLLNYVLKSIYERQRPDFERVIEASGFSFPSGHAMNAVTFYGMLAMILFFIVQKEKMKIVVCVGFSILILLIGVSRVYLGVHYVSDILAGYLAGLAWLIAMLLIYRSILLERKL